MSESFEVKSVWRETNGHRRWLAAEADALFAFYEVDLIHPAGGFATLDDSGRAMASETAVRCT